MSEVHVIGIRWSKIDGQVQYFAGWSTNVSGHRYALTTSTRNNAVVVTPADVHAVRNAGFQWRRQLNPLTITRVLVYDPCMRYMDMTPEELRESYTTWRAALYGWSRLAAPKARDGGKSARGTGRALREVEFIENVARKRGVKL